MSFITVFCWPAYIKSEGDDPSVFRLASVLDDSEACYSCDAGNWSIIVKRTPAGDILTLPRERTDHEGRHVVTAGDDLMYSATWEENLKSNGRWAIRCDCARIYWAAGDES